MSKKIPVWSPAPHYHFGERLLFYLIKVESFPRKHYDHVLAQLDQIRAFGRCAYQIFGTFDILLRVWTTELKRQQIKDFLVDNDKIIKLTTLVAENGTYFSDADPGVVLPCLDGTEDYANLINENQSLISSIQEAAARGELTENDPGLLALIGKKLVVKTVDKEKLNGPLMGTKFFSFVSYNGVLPIRQVRERLIRYIADNKKRSVFSELREVSIYTADGSGDYQFILKGVVDRVYAIYPALDMISEHFFGLDVGFETHIVAVPSTEESDAIDTTKPVYEQAAAELGRWAKCEVAKLLRHQHLMELYALYSTVNDRFTDPEQNHRVQLLFRGYIEEEPALIHGELMLLIGLEDALKKFSMVQMRKSYGVDWGRQGFDAVKARMVSSGNLDWEHLKWNEMGLGKYAILMGYLDDQSGGEITRDLGERWREHVQLAAELRNKFFHGRLPNVTEWAEWSKILGVFCDILPILTRLSRTIEGN